MRRYNRFRSPYFQDLLVQARKRALSPQPEREIVRRPGNPMLRYAVNAGDNEAVPQLTPSTQEILDL
jgi:hypothetical protein